MRKIKTGKIEIGADEFNPKLGKFRVNMFVDLDVVDDIRKLAAKRRLPYQTLINQVLREYVTGKPQELEDRLTELERFVHKKLG